MEQITEETIELLKEFKNQLLPCIYSAKNLLTKLQSGELNSDNGNSLLDLKNKMFLSYLIDLTQLTSCKLNGKSISNHSALERIVEERTVLEKIRPIEHKLKYQIDQLMRILNTGIVDQNDPMQLKPDFSALAANNDKDNDGEDQIIDLDNTAAGGGIDNDEEEEDLETSKPKTLNNKNGIYVPPRLAQMKYEDEEERKNRALEHAKKRAMNTSIMKEFRSEFDDTPEEEYDSHDISYQKSNFNKFLKEKKRYEEDNFIRLNLTKKQKQQARKLSTMTTIADDITRFEDISALDIQDANEFIPQRKRRKTTTTGAGTKKKNKSIKKKFHKKR